MTNWKSIRIACGTLALGLVLAASGHSSTFSHENRLTFSGAVSLPGVVLPAGAYSFEVVVEGSTTRDIVVVRNANRTKLFYLGFTRPIERPKNMPQSVAVTFGETPANQPPHVAVWYEAGSSTGHEFLYR